MPIQPTASRTGLFLQCPRPFHPSTTIEVGDTPGAAAEYGTRFHAALHARIFEGHLDALPNDRELSAHVDSAYEVLRQWLTDSPFGQLQVVEGEIPRAFDLLTSARRVCGFDAATHSYALDDNEVGGTADLVCRTQDDRVVVVDYKTGQHGDLANPAIMGQMLTLALIHDADIVAVLHTPPGVPPSITAAELQRSQLEHHHAALLAASSRVDEEDAYMRPGPECGYCPARFDCPTRLTDIEKSALSLARRLTPDRGLTSLEESDAGALHQLISQFDTLAKEARARLRARVEAGERIVRPDGKVLTIIDVEAESLSKSSIERALGKSDGAAVIDELRKKGCVSTTKRKELRAK